VGEVETHHIHTGIEQAFLRLHIIGSRTERSDNLGTAKHEYPHFKIRKGKAPTGKISMTFTHIAASHHNVQQPKIDSLQCRPNWPRHENRQEKQQSTDFLTVCEQNLKERQPISKSHFFIVDIRRIYNGYI
jgi:hypothetical protein